MPTIRDTLWLIIWRGGLFGVLLIVLSGLLGLAGLAVAILPAILGWASGSTVGGVAGAVWGIVVVGAIERLRPHRLLLDLAYRAQAASRQTGLVAVRFKLRPEDHTRAKRMLLRARYWRFRVQRTSPEVTTLYVWARGSGPAAVESIRGRVEDALSNAQISHEYLGGTETAG